MTRTYPMKLALRPARKVVVEGKEPEPVGMASLPVVRLWYPRGGKGEPTRRFVRVLEMNNTHIKGFEIAGELDEELGKPHTYLRSKVPFGTIIEFLRLGKPPKK